MITKPSYQASFLNDLFKSKTVCQTKLIKIKEYVQLNINEFIQDPSIITLAYPGMQIHQLWSNFPDTIDFPDTILAFDVSTCIFHVSTCILIRIMINR